ncbi:unnamed protein product [marine sediment metagenome]|uniref:Uncharacterized protein n=1 Tax=marine sediment metagenome TaxID=412755 RepID=X0SL65_9ZZZZ
MICEKCGEICYLIDVEITISNVAEFLSGLQSLKKTFKCLKCGAEIEVPKRKKKAEGCFVIEGEMRVWKPGKRGEGPAEGVT